jgi:predicted Rossmann fold nucleotide-binding protein DprA/Smf involved in DNA uptake
LPGPLSSYGEKYKSLISAPLEKPTVDKLNDEESQLLGMLDYEPIQIDELDTPWPMDKLLQLLIGMELKGIIVSEQGYYTRI